MKKFCLLAALAAVLLALRTPASAQALDVNSLARAARAAVVRYEQTERWLAPVTFVPRGGQECDETVGRFCLTFDSLSKPPREPERPEVGAARERAVSALHAYLGADPGELDAAGPLVRLLVEAKRAAEALTVATAFAASSPDSVWGDWLSGYALHAAGEDGEATRHFRRALAAEDSASRAEITRIDWLLSPAEWRRVSQLPTAQREAYEAFFWWLADPMWLTPANEVWVEHVARYVEARLLADSPRVLGAMRWGRDLDQLTVRYGTPVSRERDVDSPYEGWSFIEHFDTAALAYAPAAMLTGGLDPVRPGDPWPLGSASARSGHAPPAIRETVPLAYQLTRIPSGDSMVLRLDAAAALGDGQTAEALLAALPWHGGNVARDHTYLSGDSASFTLAVRVPRDSVVFSAEMFERTGRRLRRARYLVEPLSATAVELSDVLITRPLPDTSAGTTAPPALTSLLVPADAQLGIRVVVSGLVPGQPMAVEVGFARADSPSLLARAVGWAGQRLGLRADPSPPRVRWQATAQPDAALSVNMPAPQRPGFYYLQVLVRTARETASSRRLLRVVASPQTSP